MKDAKGREWEIERENEGKKEGKSEIKELESDRRQQRKKTIYFPTFDLICKNKPTTLAFDEENCYWIECTKLNVTLFPSLLHATTDLMYVRRRFDADKCMLFVGL